MGRLRPIHLAVLALVGTYLVTTGLGAAIFPFQFGREQLAAFLYPQPFPLEWMTSLGTPLYWFLLLTMIVVAPAVAVATERSTGRIASEIRLPEIPTWIPIAIAAAMSAFCIYKLAAAGGLTAREAWDRSICYEGKILRRIELFTLLGTRYYCFVYSSLPIIGCYLLAQGIKRKDTLALVGCAVVSLLIFWFDIAIMMKAPAVIYIGTLGLTLGLSGFGLVRSGLVTLPIAVAVYVGLSVTQFCTTQPASWELIVPPAKTASEPLPQTAPATLPDAAPSPLPQAAPTPLPKGATTPPAPSAEHSTSLPPTDPGVSTPTPEVTGKPAVDKALYMLRTVLFRMAAGFPYYVQTFSEPDERCGVERPALRWLPRQSCFGPIKVFRTMYPKVTYATGFQPGPVNASAYGEAGVWYVLIATAACGLLIGLLAGFARDKSPLAITVTVACCIYAYYVSQTSLVGSLIDSYGLAWLLIPVVVMTGLAKAVEMRRSHRNAH